MHTSVIESLAMALPAIIDDCARFYWAQINGAIVCTPLPNSFANARETPLFLLANNKLDGSGRKPLDVDYSTIRRAAEVLALPYDVAFDLELHARFKNKRILHTAGAMSLWLPRFDEEIRKRLESLLISS